MTFDLQTAVALLIVAAVVVILFRRLMRWSTGNSQGCGSCEDCPQAQSTPASSLVNLSEFDRTSV